MSPPFLAISRQIAAPMPMLLPTPVINVICELNGFIGGVYHTGGVLPTLWKFALCLALRAFAPLSS